MNWIENGMSDVAFHCSESKTNIFLIGDSIRRGYCAAVKEKLADTAEVFYVNDNCRNTQYVLTNLKRWVKMFDDRERVDLVHFNCGHWDVAHWNGCMYSLTSEGEYARNIGMIIQQLQQFFPNAKLIFATTTPMNPDSGSIGAVNPRSNEEIERYNRIAVAVAEEHGVSVSDLYAYMQGWGGECYADYCHLTPSAFACLGEEVARRLRTFAEKMQG